MGRRPRGDMPGRIGLVLLVVLVPGAPAATQGPLGPADIAAREIVSVSSEFSSADSKSASVICPAGKTLVGGGGYIRTAQPTPDVVLQASYPSAANTWTARAIAAKPLSMNWAVVAYAVCAPVRQ